MTSQLSFNITRRPAMYSPAHGARSVSSPFRRLASTLCVRLAELLLTQVIVVDDHGIILAGGSDALIGRRVETVGEPWQSECHRVPLYVAGQHGAAIIGTSMHSEPISLRLAENLVDMIVKEVQAVEHLPQRGEIKDMLIYDLLNGVISDEQTVLRQSRMLGLDLATPRAIILIDASSYILSDSTSCDPEQGDVEARSKARQVIEAVVSFFQLPNDTICTYIGEGEVVVLKASNSKNLVSWVNQRDTADHSNTSWANIGALRRAGEDLLVYLQNTLHTSVTLGIGRYYPGIHGLAYSYQDARAALSLGRHFHGYGRAHCLDRLGVVAFVGLSDERTKIDLASYLLSPLDHEPELIRTLDCFFCSDCCPSSTVAKLAIHRNTLSYRLDKITALIGLDPRRFDDAVQIRLSLLLRSLSTSAEKRESPPPMRLLPPNVTAV